MKMSGETIEIQKGSGNIFKDLEVSNPDEYLEKARLAFIIEDYITESGLRLEEVAKILNLSTMKLSNLMDGLLDDFSVDSLSSLIRILNSSAVELPDRPTDRFFRWFPTNLQCSPGCIWIVYNDRSFSRSACLPKFFRTTLSSSHYYL